MEVVWAELNHAIRVYSSLDRIFQLPRLGRNRVTRLGRGLHSAGPSLTHPGRPSPCAKTVRFLISRAGQLPVTRVGQDLEPSTVRSFPAECPASIVRFLPNQHWDGIDRSIVSSPAA